MNQSSLPQNQVKPSKSYPTDNDRHVAKSEFIDGRSAAKPAANRWHNIISTNLVVAIGSRINRNSCELYSGDMPVRFGKDSICLPDLVMVNGEPSFSDGRSEILLNPTLIAEIFSGVSKSTDRMEKLEGFLAIPNIKECLLVNETETRVEHYARQNAKQWIYRIYDEKDDVISLESVGVKLSLSEVYAQIKIKESELSSKAVN
ncbi:MAG: Uma2 family endonuclease [Pyrinomonadaceae bacterium]